MWTATEMRRKRYEAGFCTECGKSPPREGKTTCAECARKQSEYNRAKWERQKRKHGLPLTDERGRYNSKYVYTVWRGSEIVKRGTSREIADYLGMSQNEVCNYARTGIRRKRADVFIEREAIANGKV